MAELQEHSLDSLVDYGSFHNDDEPPQGIDADFGDHLPMFDSNAAEAPMSSMAEVTALEPTARAPDATMSVDEPSPAISTKKSKRDKKGKKAAESSAVVAEPHEEGNHRRSKRQSKQVELAASGDASTADNDSIEHTAASGTSKRKRKSRDSGEAEGQKKRRSKGTVKTEPAEGSSQDASAFLHRDKPAGADLDEAVANEEPAAADPQGSPTVAHLRRRSQSHEATSRRNSTVEGTQTQADGAGQLDSLDQTALDVERIARDAVFNTMSSLNQPEVAATQDGNGDVTMTEGDPLYGNGSGVYGDPQSPEPPSQPTETIAAQPKRSMRAKKSKPTYFEAPPTYEEDYQGEQDGFAQLPSPSAATPKPRRRAKPATKKAQPKRLSRSMRGGSDEDADGDSTSRRNRMAGFTQGRFTDEELERIGGAVARFRDEHQISQHQVNEMIHAPGGTTAGEEHAQLWAGLFAECPDRHRQKVINITRKKYHNFVARGTWTAEQEHELKHLIEVHGQKWSKIAGIINRHPEDIRDRYRNYVICGDNQRKDAWSEDEEKRLTMFVIEAMTALDEMRVLQPQREMLRKPYEELIDWQYISERMDRTRSRLQCITKWKSMNLRVQAGDQLDSSQPDSQISFQLDRARRQLKDMPEEERFRLLLAIKNSAAGTEARIPWQKMVDKAFRSEWHRSTQALMWHRFKKTVPGWEAKSVRDNAQYLIDQYNTTAELPDIDGDDFDSMEEMQCIQSLTVSRQGYREGKLRSAPAVSAELVENSDAEDGNEILQNGGETKSEQPAADDGMQIDPALIEAAAPSTEPPPAEVPRTEEQAAGGEHDAAPSNGQTLTQDPIEEDENATAAVEPAEAGPEEAGSEVEDVKPRKKKTPSKFKSPGAAGRRKKKASSPKDVSLASSDMEDMADVPARI